MTGKTFKIGQIVQGKGHFTNEAHVAVHALKRRLREVAPRLLRRGAEWLHGEHPEAVDVQSEYLVADCDQDGLYWIQEPRAKPDAH